MFTISYSDPAISDIKAIVAHYREINTVLVAKLDTAFTYAETKLSRNPQAFRKTGFKTFRRILLKGFPYKIVYLVEEKEVRIFAVFHQARSQRSIRRRLNQQTRS